MITLVYRQVKNKDLNWRSLLAFFLNYQGKLIKIYLDISRYETEAETNVVVSSVSLHEGSRSADAGTTNKAASKPRKKIGVKKSAARISLDTSSRSLRIRVLTVHCFYRARIYQSQLRDYALARLCRQLTQMTVQVKSVLCQWRRLIASGS